jgi:hypothetical protein
MKNSVTLSANVSAQLVCNVVKKRDLPQYLYTIWADGSFGSGTLTWYASRNSGVTLVPLTDLTDTAVTMTTAKMYNGALNTGSNNTDRLGIYVALTSASNPNITAIVYDNNN